MEKYFITFRSVTYGQKGEKSLKKAGISCSLQRTPRWMESRGCGYAVLVEKPRAAVAVLREKSVQWEKIYRVSEGSTPREVKL